MSTTEETVDLVASNNLAGRRASASRTAWALLAFAVGMYGLTAGGHTYSSDEEGMYQVTQSLATEGTPYLERREPNKHRYRQVGRDGHMVSPQVLGPSLAGLPLYLAGAGLARAAGPERGNSTRRLVVGWTNSLAGAGAVVLLFLIAVALGAARRWAVVLALVYGFGTMAWAYARAPLLSEPLASLLVLAAVYFAIRGARTLAPRALAAAGAFAGLAIATRPNMALFAPVIAAYVAWTLWRERGGAASVLHGWLALSAGATLPVAFVLFSNWWRFGSVLDFGIPHPEYLFAFPIHEGLYGLFLSPGKSVFLYSPVTLLGLAALGFAPRERRPEVALLTGIAFANALLFAGYWDWHGDHAWGPRYLSVSVPLWTAIVALLLHRVRWRRALAVAGVAGVAITSLAVVMNFNTFYVRAAVALDNRSTPTGPTYWGPLHYEPYWSPVAGHARLLMDVARGTRGRAARDTPQPQTPSEMYDWYLEAAPQLDNWMYWTWVTGGPAWLFLFALPFAAAAGLGGARLWPLLRRPDTE